MAKTIKKQKNTNAFAKEIGAGLAAAGAAAALGYYFYGSDDAKKHRKIAAKWASDMKREVVRETKHLKKVSPETFAAVVDTVARTYRGARAIDAKELSRAARELKAHWKTIQREASSAKRSASNTVKTVKKAAKKVRRAAAKRR